MCLFCKLIFIGINGSVSLELGFGVSTTGGTADLAKGVKSGLQFASYKDLFTKLLFMPINVQTYFLIYGNGGE